MAKFRTAGEEIHIPPDEPHDDWRPIHGDPQFAKWHPPVGESHIKYHVYPIRRSNQPTVWRANCHGLYQGMGSLTNRGDNLTFPQYDGDFEPVGIPHYPSGRRNFRTMDDAKAAAERYHAENYGNPRSAGDHDIDAIMREHGAPPAPRTGLGDDEDYGHIFGRRLARPGRGPSRGHQCDHCGGHARSAYEVNQVSIGDDYKGSFCDNCLQELLPSWYGGGDR